MKSAPFHHHRPTTLDEALALLAEHGDDAKVLAGGQSLVPLMALRLGRPTHVVDLGAVPGLDAITALDDGGIELGAMVRHVTAERSTEVARAAPLVAEAMPWVGHRAIRSRGTVVGSVAHGDPAAEMPAVVLATGATMVASSTSGTREIAAADFFEGYLQTALRPDELLISIRFPAWGPDRVGAVVEVARRHGDYALVGVVVALRLDGDVIADATLAYFGAASTPVRAAEAEAVLVGATPSTELFARAGEAAATSLDPPGDIHGSAAYRRHVAGVVTRRGLEAAATKIGAPA